MWFLTRFEINQSVQSQKQARSLRFWVLVEEGLYYLYSKNKGVISFAVTAKLICVFVFSYADCWFSGYDDDDGAVIMALKYAFTK